MNYAVIRHSAKGSEWEDHKYIKRIDGTYYYPDSYEGGRHLPDGEKGDSGSKYGEYKDGDSDFDDKNYTDKNRLGNTDFFGFKRPDGTSVIVEEDMKWELPKGTEITPEIAKRLEFFNKQLQEFRKAGGDLSNKEWTKMVKDVIDGKISSPSSDGKLSDKDIDNLANEVMRGNFGNGGQRKELLGDDYDKIQKKVNELMKSSKSSSDKSSSTSETKKEEKADKEDKNTNSKAYTPMYNNKEYQARKKKEQKEKEEKEKKLKHSDDLYHYGMPRRSGRYPWGSGERPHQSLGRGKKKGSSDGISNTDSEHVKKLKTTKKVLNETSNALNTIDYGIDDGSRNQERKWERMDLHNMSDQELRDRINRENLEIQYSKLFNSKDPEVNKGKKFVKDLLKFGVEGIKVTGSVVGIMLAIAELKKYS